MARRLIRLKRVSDISGSPPSTIYLGMKKGTFPKSIPIGDRAVAWDEDEILEWVEKRIAEAGDRALVLLSHAAEEMGITPEDLEPFVESGDLPTVIIGKNVMVKRMVIDNFQRQHVEANQGESA